MSRQPLEWLDNSPDDAVLRVGDPKGADHAVGKLVGVRKHHGQLHSTSGHVKWIGKCLQAKRRKSIAPSGKTSVRFCSLKLNSSLFHNF